MLAGIWFILVVVDGSGGGAVGGSSSSGTCKLENGCWTMDVGFWRKKETLKGRAGCTL